MKVFTNINNLEGKKKYSNHKKTNHSKKKNC